MEVWYSFFTFSTTCLFDIVSIERFSIGCGKTKTKTKTKVIATCTANQKKGKYP